ncbi:cell surface protein [Clostridium sp. AWRP]|uniref:cell surface protein n=1 Tax=Clostridium sp. AWRP TaxID=2212991 RepID=UPI000FDCD4A9|nr:cell surface protein [Clostridium sp. AWRP]AZV57194.1 cell surface protein [Clostridium sp. AWRP]
MKRIWKKISLVMMLIFTLMTFAPYTARADASPSVSMPSLTQDTDGNYTVSSVDDLNKLRGDIDNGIDYSGKKVILIHDIDISKSSVPLKSFTTNKNFDGTFDGKFNTISSYTDAVSGLFGIVGKDGIVEDVKVNANVTVTDASKVITSTSIEDAAYGLITNQSAGIISKCSTKGMIRTNEDSNGTVAGIVGDSAFTDDDWNEIDGNINNCYSNVTFDNTADGSRCSGICTQTSMNPGRSVDHSYFYGKILGKSNKFHPIISLGDDSASTCAYDSDVLGFSSPSFMGSPVGYTTAQMKDKDSYIKLGFDFDKIWKIDPSVNDGYPYLNPDSSTKTVTKVVVDVQVTVPDKMFVPGTEPIKNTDDCLKTTATFKVVPEFGKDADLISKYNVTCDGNVFFDAPTIGNVPISIDSSKLKINYTPNEDYQFILGKVIPSTAKLLDNGAAALTQDVEKQQVENAKEVENILYDKLKIAQGDVPEFTWDGNKAAAPGMEGTVVLNDYVWEVFSSARSGYTGVRKGFYDDWFKNIQNGLEKMKEAGIAAGDVKMTEWEKLVLAITAIGYDPRDIKSYNLLDIISNKNYLEVSPEYFTPQYDVYALTSYNYMDFIPNDGKHISKDDIEKNIHVWAKNALGSKGADGSVVAENTAPDMWTMALQPIAAYYNPNAKEGDKYYDVKQAMDHAFAQFSNAQTYKGSFWGGFVNTDGTFDLNNPWTNAQVYMTLGMAKANVFDKEYIKDGKTIFDAILEGFDAKNKTTQYDNLTYDPVQICRGIDSLVRDYEGRNSIFDCTDVKNSTVPVNNAIAALPNVDKLTSADKDKVDGVEKSYDALSDAQKSSMKQETVGKLTAAEKKVSGSQGETKPIKITNLTKDSSFKLGNDAKVSVKAENNSGKDKDTSLLVALYDGSDKFVKYVCGKQTIKDGDSSILTGIMKLPEEGIYKLKAFVWDSLENMNPLSDIIDIPVQSNK